MIRAILFDLDGTLVDSVPWHEDALNRSLQEVAGFQIGEFENKETFRGRLTRDKLYILLEQGRISSDQLGPITEGKKKYLQSVISGCASPDWEKIRMLDSLREQDFLLACVTNSNRDASQVVLRSVGLLDKFNVLVTGSDVVKHKPCSEGYIVAMTSLGVFPKECVIVEDSIEGIISARNTGSHVWEVSGAEEVTRENLNKFLEEIK